MKTTATAAAHSEALIGDGEHGSSQSSFRLLVSFIVLGRVISCIFRTSLSLLFPSGELSNPTSTTPATYIQDLLHLLTSHRCCYQCVRVTFLSNNPLPPNSSGAISLRGERRRRSVLGPPLLRCHKHGLVLTQDLR